MCTPILIAAAALSVGSVVANSVATSQQASARNDVLAAERIRQHGFDQQTAVLNNQSRDRYVDFVPQQQATAAHLGDVLGARVASDPNATTGTALPSSTSSVVNQEVGKQEGNAQSFVDQQGMARANMRSFGDLLGEISGKQARDAASVGQIGGFKTSSAGLTPLELDNASHAGDGMMTLGDILAGLGSVGVSAGVGSGNPLSNLFAPKAAAVAPSFVGGVTPFNPRLALGGALGVT